MQTLARLKSALVHSGPALRFLFAGALIIHLLFISNLGGRFFNPLSHDMTFFRQVRGVDFNAVYAAGLHLRNGVNIYKIPTADEGIPHTRFRYMPPAAFFPGLPLSLIPNVFRASLVWAVFTELLLLINLYLTLGLVRREEQILPSLCLWLLYFPWCVEIFMGQSSFLLASLLFWSLLALDKKREAWALVAWIPAVLLKIFPLALVPVLWKRGSRRALVLSLGVIFVLCAPYFFIQGEALGDFLSLNFRGGVPVEAYLGNPGPFHALLYLRSLAPLVSVEHLALIFRLAGLALGVALVYFSLAGRRPLYALYSLSILIFFFFSLEVWEHHFVMLMPFFVLHYLRTEKSRSLLWGAFILCAAPSLYGLLFLDGIHAFGLQSVATGLYFIIKPLGLLLFGLVIFRDLSSGGGRKESS